MALVYNPSIKTLLKNTGITPGKKSLVFFITLVAVTLPLEHAFNSFAIICFVLFSLLSASQFRPTTAFMLPILLFLLMCLSLLWSPSLKISATALSKEASLLFIPLAFMFCRPLTYKSHTSVLKSFSFAMCVYGGYLVIRALVRYIALQDPSVFFYNELASENISVYLSSFFSLALFFFLSKPHKTFWGYVASVFMLCMVMLLSKKSIILTDAVIIVAYYLFFSKEKPLRRLVFATGFCMAGTLFVLFGNLAEPARGLHPAAGHTNHVVTVNEALNRKNFNQNDYFSGLSFRAYRARTLAEMSTEKGFVLTGSGINTSGLKMQQIAQQHNTTHPGWENVPYNKLNFHNQYMEAYADLGIFGLLLVVALLAYGFTRAILTKYFIHLAFIVLMISLFLTESFLWRQKGVVFFTLFYCFFTDFKPERLLKDTK